MTFKIIPNGQVYAVFFRLEGVREDPTDLLVTKWRILGSVMKEVCGEAGIPWPDNGLSSPYGRVLLIPGDVARAINTAKSILKQSASQKVALQIGIAVGPVEQWTDLHSTINYAGPVINNAARLAFCEDPEFSEKRILLQDRVHADAEEAFKQFRSGFSEEREGRVKRTSLTYRLMDDSEIDEIEMLDPEEVNSRTHYIVAYDIAQYSEMSLGSAMTALNSLRDSINASLASSGGRRYMKPYLAAGDGGFLVFPDTDGGAAAALSFTRALLAHAEEQHIRIRIGMTTGQLAWIEEDRLPIGRGIFRADELSGLAHEGAAATKKRFWDDVTEPKRVDWVTSADPEVDDLIHIQSTSGTAFFHVPGSAESRANQAYPRLYKQAIEFRENNPEVHQELKDWFQAEVGSTFASESNLEDLIPQYSLWIFLQGVLKRGRGRLKAIGEGPLVNYLKILCPLGVQRKFLIEDVLPQLKIGKISVIPLPHIHETVSTEIVKSAIADEECSWGEIGDLKKGALFGLEAPFAVEPPGSRVADQLAELKRSIMLALGVDPDDTGASWKFQAKLQARLDSSDPFFVLFREGKGLEEILNKDMNENNTPWNLVRVFQKHPIEEIPKDERNAILPEPAHVDAKLAEIARLLK